MRMPGKKPESEAEKPSNSVPWRGRWLDGTRGMLLERIMNESGLQWDKDGGALRFDTTLQELPEAIFRFGQALTRVYDLTEAV